MSTDKTEEYRQKLFTDFPDLDIKTAKIIGSGWHHDAVEVNGTIVFRIPRFDHASDVTDESVGYETAVLRLLRGKLKIAIPDPLYVAKNNRYFGYPKLGGVLLADRWSGLSESEKDAIIEAWVDIVAEIHDTVPLAKGKELRIPLFADPKEPIGSTAKKIDTVQGLDQVVYDFAKKVLKQSESIGVQSHQDTVIHNDLHLFNMLIDPESHRLTGVIDWTDICIGPLEREFCAWEWGQDDSLEKAIKLYEAKTGKKVNIDEARFWKHIETVSDLVEAAETNDQQKIKESIEIIKYWSKRMGL